MSTPVYRFGDHAPTGNVEFDEVTGSDHVWYGQRCPCCDEQFRIGKIVVTITLIGPTRYVMCGRCLDFAASRRPPDFDQQRVDRIGAESSLAEWVREIREVG